MKLFEPHIHMTSRTTDDYEAMARAGIRAVLEPASWIGQPRTHVGTFEDYFTMLVGWERFRASGFGIRHYCALALDAKEANDPVLAEGVLAILPRYLAKEGVLAVGEIGFDAQTPAEETYFVRQLELACRFELPVLVHTPQRDKKHAVERTLALLRAHEFPMQRVLIGQNTEETLPLVLDAGAWAGHSIYPQTKMDEARMAVLVRRYGAERMVVNSAADWGSSDPLAVPRAAVAMRRAGIAEHDIERIVWSNPISFFGQSRRLSIEEVEQTAAVDQRHSTEEGSARRDQPPVVGAR